jgi:hypothetical protein
MPRPSEKFGIFRVFGRFCTVSHSGNHIQGVYSIYTGCIQGIYSKAARKCNVCNLCNAKMVKNVMFVSHKCNVGHVGRGYIAIGYIAIGIQLYARD